MKRLIIASTFLHLLDAYLLAKEYRDDKFFLIYLDKENELFTTIKSNFSKSWIIKDNKDSFFKKIKSRKKAIKSIEAIIKKINPDEIILGNDRKIQTAWIKEYSYMDDGLYSYKLEKQYPLKYSFFEKILKSLLYGKNLQVPKYVGQNAKRAYLFEPSKANEILQTKELIKLNKKHLYLLPRIEIKQKAIAILPHPKFINFSIPKDIAIKPHPRDTNKYKGYEVIKDIPFEILLLSLAPNTTLYLSKDSTPYFLAKLIREDINYKDINEISI